MPMCPLKNSKLTRQGAARLCTLQPEGETVSPQPPCLPRSSGDQGRPCRLPQLPVATAARVLVADIPFPCRAEVVLGNIIKKKGWR